MTDRTPETIAAEIMSWDRQDIRRLHQLLCELDQLANEQDFDTAEYIDVTSLPSGRDVPEELADYPVWAVDVDGECITEWDYRLPGQGISTLDEVRAAKAK